MLGQCWWTIAGIARTVKTYLMLPLAKKTCVLCMQLAIILPTLPFATCCSHYGQRKIQEKQNKMIIIDVETQQISPVSVINNMNLYRQTRISGPDVPLILVTYT